jgi:hypothetical protein
MRFVMHYYYYITITDLNLEMLELQYDELMKMEDVQLQALCTVPLRK